MGKVVNKLFASLTILSGFSLALSYLSVYINPTTFWFFGAMGLAYPFLLLLNLSFLVFWIIRWKALFLFPLAIILLGAGHFTSFFQFPFGKNLEPREDDIKIISYNVNLFQLYNWSKEPPTQHEIFNFIKNENPDIVCLQEFYVINKKFSEKQAREKLDFFTHFGYISKRNNSGYGLATYSRYLIINKGEIKFENSANACIYSDIIIGYDTIRVYNTHLQSIRLKEHNLNFLLDQNYRKDAQAMNEIKDISVRYRDALRKRARQVQIVTEHILSSPYPVIVCGDFNDSPISFNYRQMRQNLNDAFIEAGKGVGHTYKGIFPSFRIDYILYDRMYSATSYYNPRIYFSDHYPVVATLAVRK